MKRMPVIYDFADADELDLDALEAIEEFEEGILSFEELKDLVGSEAAQVIQNRRGEERDPNSYFDDPENF